MNRTLASALALSALGALAGAAVLASKSPDARDLHPAWSEAKWPFPIDQWGTGRAFLCKAEGCGVEVDLYLRAKIGFCNCTTGVSDDEELERVADVTLLGDKFSAPGPGREIAVAWMKGRSRSYDVAGRHAGSTLAIAFNDRCDVVVATAVVPSGPAGKIEPAILAFLNSDTVIHWAQKTLGL
jgi:hypothetical protein